jgi:nucleoside-diphosphate-sugar epimerase
VKVLVTGATGFLGCRVVAELLRRGHGAVCLVRSAERAQNLDRALSPALKPAAQFVTGELTDARSCSDLIDNCDAVVHLAARMTGAPSVLFASAVVGTRTLVDAAVERRVRRFVLVSSVAVYATAGLPANSVVDESCALDPKPHLRDAYTYSKIEQERVAWDAAQRGLPLVVVRPAVLFGPGRTVLSGRVGLRIGPLMVRMGSHRLIPCSYVENCARAVALAVEVPGVDGQAFNVVDDQLPSAREMFRAYTRGVASVPAITVPQWAIPSIVGAYEWCSRRSNGQFPPVVTRYRSSAQWKPLCFSNQRAKRVLGWRPSVPLGDALQITIAALRRNTAAGGRC